jgi:hypothetical protein
MQLYGHNAIISGIRAMLRIFLYVGHGRGNMGL